MEVNEKSSEIISWHESVEQSVSAAYLPLSQMLRDCASSIEVDPSSKSRFHQISRLMCIYKATISISKLVDDLRSKDINEEEFYKSTWEVVMKTIYDDAETDGTDFAHPAWWRGHDQACQVSCRIFEDWIDQPIREPAYGGECFNRAYRKLAGLKKKILND